MAYWGGAMNYIGGRALTDLEKVRRSQIGKAKRIVLATPEVKKMVDKQLEVMNTFTIRSGKGIKSVLKGKTLPKKERTAAQKIATKKLIESNQEKAEARRLASDRISFGGPKLPRKTYKAARKPTDVLASKIKVPMGDTVMMNKAALLGLI